MDVYGIDLGTTYSCIAEIDPVDKLPIVIRNQEQMQTTESVVYFDDFCDPIVGLQAKNGMKQDPTHAVAFIKREMSNPNYRRTIGNEVITPVKISAMILKKVVDDANLIRESKGLKPIRDVVITVPAYFENDERVLTRQAGEIAGLNVLGLLNEPTAAALSYGAANLEGKTFMVYDLGGGTFDVSIMTMHGGELETLATDGNHRLGGVDWDTVIVNYMLNMCGSNETYADIKDTRDGGSLILAAEICKKLLSNQDQAPMKFRYKGRMITKTMSRGTFEELTAELLDQTIKIVRKAMSESTKPLAKLDEIILVGGSSRMPMVRRRLMDEFPSTKIRLDMFEPDLAVAKGAAIHAYNLANNPVRPKVKIAKDLSSRSYGIACYDENKNDVIRNILLRTDPIVFSSSTSFETSNENQTAAKITLFENTSVQKRIPEREGTMLSSKEISWGYGVPKGTKVTAYVRRNADGIVHIIVECQNHEVRFEIKPDHALTKQEVEKEKIKLSHVQL